MDTIYLSEFNLGDKFESSALTVTEAAVVMFAGITSDFHPTHMDENYCKSLPFGTRIAHGMLTASIAMALWSRIGVVEESAIAQLGCSWEFKAPVLFGDTIHDVVEITGIKRSNSKPDRGVLTFAITVYNQDGKVCATNETKALLKWDRPLD